MAKRNRFEVEFDKLARGLGFKVEPGKPIHSDTPVEDKRGKIRKTVTVPDSHVTNPETGDSVHVEVTQGAGTSPHKQAQQRVVDAAGVENYVVVNDADIADVKAEPSREERRSLLAQILGLIFIVS